MILFIQLCLSTDWFYELLRERLLEVYDKELVDKLIPYKMEDFQDFLHEKMVSITDDELNRIGMLEKPDNAKELY